MIPEILYSYIISFYKKWFNDFNYSRRTRACPRNRDKKGKRCTLTPRRNPTSRTYSRSSDFSSKGPHSAPRTIVTTLLHTHHEPINVNWYGCIHMHMCLYAVRRTERRTKEKQLGCWRHYLYSSGNTQGYGSGTEQRLLRRKHIALATI